MSGADVHVEVEVNRIIRGTASWLRKTQRKFAPGYG